MYTGIDERQTTKASQMTGHECIYKHTQTDKCTMIQIRHPYGQAPVHSLFKNN